MYMLSRSWWRRRRRQRRRRRRRWWWWWWWFVRGRRSRGWCTVKTSITQHDSMQLSVVFNANVYTNVLCTCIKLWWKCWWSWGQFAIVKWRSLRNPCHARLLPVPTSGRTNYSFEFPVSIKAHLQIDIVMVCAVPYSWPGTSMVCPWWMPIPTMFSWFMIFALLILSLLVHCIVADMAMKLAHMNSKAADHHDHHDHHSRPLLCGTLLCRNQWFPSAMARESGSRHARHQLDLLDVESLRCP